MSLDMNREENESEKRQENKLYTGVFFKAEFPTINQISQSYCCYLENIDIKNNLDFYSAFHDTQRHSQ